MRTKVIGYCGVDSGQLFITDPCYVKHTEQGNGQWNHKVVDSEYVSLNDPTLDNKQNFYTKVCEANKEGFAEVEMGVVVSTTWGDGNYAIEGIFDEEDTLLGVFINFTDQLSAEFSENVSEVW